MSQRILGVLIKSCYKSLKYKIISTEFYCLNNWNFRTRIKYKSVITFQSGISSLGFLHIIWQLDEENPIKYDFLFLFFTSEIKVFLSFFSFPFFLSFLSLTIILCFLSSLLFPIFVFIWRRSILPKKMLIRSTVYSCKFFKEINTELSLNVSEHCLHDLIYWQL